MKSSRCIRGVIVAFALVASFPAGARADTDANALSPLTYRAIGPAISGGRTSAVAGSDRDPALYYAGGAGGGVFKSTDGGGSWQPVFDREMVAPIGAIALADRDPNDVWVGTGEANPRNTVEEGAGIWHSTDGGKTWRHAGLDDAGSISSISIDPRDPLTVVVGVLGHIFRDGTMRGVYVTHDGGNRWTRALFTGPSSGVSDLTRVPDHPATLFAGMWQFRRRPWSMTSGGPAGGLYRSDDGGTTWRKLTGAGLPSGLTGRIGVAAAKDGRVYAIVQSKEGDIWRSDDGGRRWRAMPHSAMIGARPFYFSHLFVDPTNANRVVNVSLILSMSTDGARTFKPIATNAGWDYHTNWWSADGRRMIMGSDEGVVLSADHGRHWSQPYALPFSQPYHLGFDGGVPSYRICIGLQDNNSWCGPSSSETGLGVLNRDWYQVGPGDGMWARFDPRDPNLIWTTSTNSDPGQIYLYDARTKQVREVSPDARKVENAAAALDHRFNWDTPIAFDAQGTALAGGERVFASSDHGVHWSAISPDLTRNEKLHQRVSGGPISEDASGAEIADTILQIAPSQRDPGVIWVGTDDGLVHVTRDGGKSWKNVTPPGMPAWGRVYTIEPGHTAAGTAYVAVDAHMTGDEHPHIFRTDDYGAHWATLGSGLPPSVFVRSIREDPVDEALLYAGTQRGVWTSFDRGRTWHPLRLNMPATAIYDLQIDPNTSDLLVASHGRGVWILDDLTPLRAWAKARTTSVTLFAPRDAYRMWFTPSVNAFLDNSLPAGDFIGADRPSGAILTYYLARPAHKVALEIRDTHGRVVRHLSGGKFTHHAGMNRAAWDLAEDGPIRWAGTFEQNRGPKVGAEAIPGAYTVRLMVDGMTQEQPLVVKADPRDTSSAQDARVRHDFLVELYGDLSRVDAMLNALDRKRKHAAPARAAALAAFEHRLTLDQQNIEDLKTPPRLRERLLDLTGRVASTSFQEPTAAQQAEAVTLRAEFASLSAAYAAMK